MLSASGGSHGQSHLVTKEVCGSPALLLFTPEDSCAGTGTAYGIKIGM